MSLRGVTVAERGESMCQMRVVMEKDGNEEVIHENVTNIDILENGIAVTTLFEGSSEIAGAVIRRMDFLSGKVFLAPG